MRERLNNDPKAQIALVAVLVVLAGLLLLSKSGGGGESEPETVAGSEAPVSVEGASTAAAGAVPGATSATGMGELPTSVPAGRLPHAFTAAYDSGHTVVLLVVDNKGIDDAFTKLSLREVQTIEDVKAFVVPVREVPRYAAVTVGLDLSQVPALIVMRPRRLSGGTPQASVSYGFQTVQSVYQAVRDAVYKGPEGTYYPQ